MKPWGIYLYVGHGKMDFLYVTEAETREDAVKNACRHLPADIHSAICARPWGLYI